VEKEKGEGVPEKGKVRTVCRGKGDGEMHIKPLAGRCLSAPTGRGEGGFVEGGGEQTDKIKNYTGWGNGMSPLGGACGQATAMDRICAYAAGDRGKKA